MDNITCPGDNEGIQVGSELFCCIDRTGIYMYPEATSINPFWTGTAIYLGLGVIGCLAGLITGGRKYRALIVYLVSVATFCLWLMW